MKRKKNASKIVKKIKGNLGFSLIEVLLAIVILGLVAAPILQIFVTSAQMNLRSRKLMAATDVANVTMEYLTGMKYDEGTESVKTVFATTDPRMRIPALSYDCSGTTLATSYASLTDFRNHVLTSYTGHGNSPKVYINSISGDAYLGVAMKGVTYNNYTFDMIVWFQSNNTGTAQFYTYDVTVEVYDSEQIMVEASDGTSTPNTIHFTERLITVEGAVANK